MQCYKKEIETQQIFENSKAEKQFHATFRGEGFFCNPCHRVFRDDSVMRCPPCPNCGEVEGVMTCKAVTKKDLVSFTSKCSVWHK